MAKGKDFLNDIEDMDIVKGGLSSLMERQHQPSSPQPIPTSSINLVKQKQNKVRTSFSLYKSTDDKLKAFRLYQRTVNNQPFYDLSEAVEEGLKLLFEQHSFNPNSSIQPD